MATTIAAISTPEGSGGIGIVRLSGDSAVSIAEQMFRSYSGRKVADQSGYSGLLGEVFREDTKLDQVIVTRFRAPKSYTGEDVIEISCHGGSWVVAQLLRTCLDYGAVAAGPGEFTQRAFLNGKMDLLQAESVMDLINAQSTAAVNAANQQQQGALSTKIEEIVEKILKETAHLAAWADYPEEEMEMVDESQLILQLAEINGALGQLIDTFDYGQIIREGIPTAIVGKPNVGKSTLMNLLTGQDVSIVSEIPGTTRDVVRETIRMGDLSLLLADTAGIRETVDLVEQVGVERSLKQMKNAQLVLALFDYSQPLDQQDLELIELLDVEKTLILINKGDLPQKLDLELLNHKFENLLVVSALDSQGIGQLEPKIKAMLGLDRYDQGNAVLLSNERQRKSLVNCKRAIGEAADALELGVTLDAVGVCLEEALDELLVLTGKRVQEEVVHQVFAQFCVGK